MSKTQHWNYIRSKLKPEFERRGIVSCEVCGSTFALSFAHRLKRRFITDDTELKTVALLCVKCHERIEFSGHEAMYEAITKIIEKRDVT